MKTRKLRMGSGGLDKVTDCCFVYCNKTFYGVTVLLANLDLSFILHNLIAYN